MSVMDKKLVAISKKGGMAARILYEFFLKQTDWLQIKQGDLAERVGLSRNAVVLRLKWLEANNLLSVRVEKKDNRDRVKTYRVRPWKKKGVSCE
jgi:predicted ArsR family transcriptional regulator